MTPVVDDHAVVRFFERIHGFALTDAYPEATDRHLALRGCDRLGISLDEARDLVCPPRMHAAIALGNGRATTVVLEGGRALRVLLVRDGRVRTCLPPECRPRPAFGTGS